MSYWVCIVISGAANLVFFSLSRPLITLCGIGLFEDAGAIRSPIMKGFAYELSIWTNKALRSEFLTLRSYYSYLDHAHSKDCKLNWPLPVILSWYSVGVNTVFFSESVQCARRASVVCYKIHCQMFLTKPLFKFN